MTTREFLNGTKETVIANEVNSLNECASYKNGLRNANEQAVKNYETKLRSVNQDRWFKIIEQENHPTIIWSHNASMTMIVYADGNVKYDEEVNGKSSICRVIGATSNNFKSFFGTISEVLEAVKTGNFKHSKIGLLSPVEFSI